MIEETPSLVEEGVSTLKLFMAYKGDLMVEDATLYQTLDIAKSVDALVMVHAENGTIIDLLQKKCLENGQTEPYYHAVSRPIEVETEATSRAISIAEVVGAFSFKEQKELGKDDFTKIPNGGNGIEHRFSLLYTYGVAKGRLSLEKAVELLSMNQAKVMGLYPEKGTIAVGCDADLLIFDPKAESTVQSDTSHQGIDYDMFEGFSVKGRVKDVFLRGKQIVKNGAYIGSIGDGSYQKRKPYGLCYE